MAEDLRDRRPATHPLHAVALCYKCLVQSAVYYNQMTLSYIEDDICTHLLLPLFSVNIFPRLKQQLYNLKRQ